MRKNIKIILITSCVLISILLFLNYFEKEKIYTSKEYNSKRQLIGINEYVIRNNDTILNGKFERFNDKGRMISKGQFLNDHVYGYCFYYFDNGKIESLYFRKNSEINLECTYYNKKGFVEKYIMCDDYGHTALVVYYDSLGVTNYKGYFLFEKKLHKLNPKSRSYEQVEKHLKVGDKLKYSYNVANIPNAKRSFTIENLGIDNSKVKRTLKKVEPCQIDVEEVLTKKGKNTIRSIVRYEFNDGITPVLTDTTFFDINIY